MNRLKHNTFFSWLLTNMSIVLSILRDHDEADTYEISKEAISLSSFLTTMVQASLEEKEGESDQEEEDARDPLDICCIDLPVQFEDEFMVVIREFLNYFATNTLPMKLEVPIIAKSKENALHPKILEWLSGFTLDQLSRLRQIVTYFDIESLLEQIDIYLAIEIIQRPKEVFKQFHEPTLTLASTDAIQQRFPIL